MEIQIPLVIFTSFLAWAAGIFGTQCILALQKRGGAVQLPALICSAVVLVVGGIAVVFHLTHRSTCSTGSDTSPRASPRKAHRHCALAVVMVLFFLMLRRSEDDTVPQWLAVVGIVVVLVLIVAMGHSYMMPSLPAWDTVLQLLSLLGAACVMGPATVAFIGAVKGVEIEGIGLLAVIGAAVNAVLSAAYMFAMEASSATFQSFQYYFDRRTRTWLWPIRPTCPCSPATRWRLLWWRSSPWWSPSSARFWARSRERGRCGARWSPSPVWCVPWLCAS